MEMDQGKTELMKQIREGMTVLDANGDEVGEVEFVKMADPQSADLEEGPMSEPGSNLLDALDPSGDDRVSDRMLQRGYVKIDVKGLLAGDKYVLSDDIANVDGETVHLTMDKDNINDPA